MNKKILMKIRLRADGTWEHVYDDNSVDQEFHQLDANSLVHLQKHKEQMFSMAQDYLDLAVEASGYKDAKEVIDYIRGLK